VRGTIIRIGFRVGTSHDPVCISIIDRLGLVAIRDELSRDLRTRQDRSHLREGINDERDARKPLGRASSDAG
jgi:hypothetical protein